MTTPALVRTGPRSFAVARVPLEEAPGVLLRVLLAGVCGTDLQVVRGLRHEPVTVLGHEALCVVEEPDPTCPELAAGQLCTVNPTGRDDDRYLVGHTVPGVFRERMRVPSAQVHSGRVVALRSRPPGSHAALVEPLACALYSLSILGAHDVSRYVVVGDGSVGTLVGRRLTQLGVAGEDVKLVGRLRWASSSPTQIRSLFHGGSGRPLGIVVATPRDSTGTCVRAAVTHAPANSVVDVVGGIDASDTTTTPWLAEVAATRAANVCGDPRPAARLDLAPPERAACGSVTVTGHRGVSADQLRAAAGLLAADPHAFDGVVTHVVSMSQAARVLTGLAQRGRREHRGRRITKLVISMEDGSG